LPDFNSPDWYRTHQATVERAELSKDDGHQIMSLAWMNTISWYGVTKLLDIGCADGWSMQQFSNREIQCVGVTLCQEEAERAAQFGEVLVQDMHDFNALPFAPFDACWLRHTLEHALAPYIVMRNIRRHLRPGARLFVVLPSPAWDTMPTHYSPMNEHQFQALAAKTGFQVKKIEAAYHKAHDAPEGSPNDWEWWIEAVAV